MCGYLEAGSVYRVGWRLEDVEAMDEYFSAHMVPQSCSNFLLVFVLLLSLGIG